ncbi:MAG TPA: hypothetical protein PK442_15715, partial [Synergistales bacterium]|nr:hypothetical protein [Synergistales bacterium]
NPEVTPFVINRHAVKENSPALQEATPGSSCLSAKGEGASERKGAFGCFFFPGKTPVKIEK